MTKNISPIKINLIIFICFFISRYFFLYIGNFDNYDVQPDAYWYTEQSDEVLKGNFNLLRPLFITSPFFTYYQAFIKLIFGDYWEFFLEFSQVTISSISAIYLYYLSLMLFKNRRVAFLSIVVFCFYPFTFWYVGAFTQDIWFQSFLIIFMFYFTVYLKILK